MSSLAFMKPLLRVSLFLYSFAFVASSCVLMVDPSPLESNPVPLDEESPNQNAHNQDDSPPDPVVPTVEFLSSPPAYVELAGPGDTLSFAFGCQPEQYCLTECRHTEAPQWYNCESDELIAVQDDGDFVFEVRATHTLDDAFQSENLTHTSAIRFAFQVDIPGFPSTFTSRNLGSFEAQCTRDDDVEVACTLYCQWDDCTDCPSIDCQGEFSVDVPADHDDLTLFIEGCDLNFPGHCHSRTYPLSQAQ